MKAKTLSIAALLFSAVFASQSQAALVYNGGASNLSGGYYADQGYTYFEAGTNFMLDSAATVNSIKWWGAYDGNQNQTDNFFLRFYAGGATPGVLLYSFNLGASNKAATGNVMQNTWNEYSYQSTFSAINLAANTSYFISLSNQNTGTDNWFWANSNGPSNNGASNGGSWINTGASLAFELSNDGPTQAVSAPATLGLLGLSLLALGLRRRQR